LRIDSHHSFSGRYPLDHLASILKRNRFEGSVLVADDLMPVPEFVRAVVVRTDTIDPAGLDRFQTDPRFRGLCCPGVPGHLDELQHRNLSLDADLASVAEIAREYPRLRIAIRPVGEIDPAAVEEAAAFPNVCCKVAGLFATLAPRDFVRHALYAFGPERLMFGSDWPASLPDHTWKENLALFTQCIGAQSIEVREQLLGATAARFYAI
jgi:L-fuconolactonase